MSQKLIIINFKCVQDISEFDKSFIKSYNEESDKRYFLRVDFRYPKKLNDLHNDLRFLPERMKIEKVGKLVANLHDRTEYVILKRNLKQTLKISFDYGLCTSFVNIA